MSDRQTEYWDAVADSRTFTHPLPAPDLVTGIGRGNRILDYGCGYGRTCNELALRGITRITGIDISARMVARGRNAHPELDLIHFDGVTIPFSAATFQAVFLLAVLTCIPSDAGQKAVIDEITRVLRPGGLLFLSDYPLQEDDRNRRRYDEHRREFGTYGVFRLADGAVVRHLATEWMHELLSRLTIVRETELEVRTMNGNPARIAQIVARKD